MRIAIRTTCGRSIGFGHLRRCLTLAEELQRRGHAPALWITGDETGPRLVAEAGIAAEHIEKGVAAVELRLQAAQPELLVVDDYALSAADIAQLHRRVRLAVVDDLADRALDADLIQNGNANAAELDYHSPPACVRLLGPRYSLLRAEFRARPRRTAPAQLRRVLVMLGGSDARGLTTRVARLCRQLLTEVAVDVVVGPLASLSDELSALDVTIHRAPPDLVTLMTNADLAVSAGGQTNYELAACGLPAVSICVADNQRGNLAALASVPTLLATFDDDDAGLRASLERLAQDRPLRQILSDAGQDLVDGLGAVRVAEALERKDSDG